MAHVAAIQRSVWLRSSQTMAQLFTCRERQPGLSRHQKYERLTNSTIAIVTYTPPPPFSTVSILTPINALCTPEKVLEILNIKKEPIKVMVNGAEYSVDYLNS